MPHKTLIIAEIGVNHNGRMDLAIDLFKAAKECGADIAKIQSFKAAKLTTPQAGKAHYQQLRTDKDESQQEMLRKLELSFDDQKKLLSLATEIGIRFLSSPFDLESSDWLIDSLKLDTIKIGSGELTNGPLLYSVAQKGAQVILSTGMATTEEIECAMSVLAFGYSNKSLKGINADELAQLFSNPDTKKILKSKVQLLHCTTEYPAPFSELNLQCLESMRSHFGVPIGFSDHTPGIEAPIAAVALGATVIEKHFTLDKSLPGPDHKASLNPSEFRKMVDGIRNIETGFGDGIKKPTESELKNKPIARKSLVAAKNIKKGELFSSENLTSKRPGNGLSPMNYWALLETPSPIDYEEDELIQL